jgi:hypothetical protein
VLLHERRLREFVAVWRRAKAANVKLPESTNAAYASMPALLLHGLGAVRNYMVWCCESLGLPDPGIETAPTAEQVETQADRYVAHLLERWRLPLADVDPPRFRETHKTRWGAELSIEGMLEHAVLHAEKHQFQLEELMEAQGIGGKR